MAKKWRTCPYFGIRFSAITQPFLGQFDWKFWLELMRLLSIDKWWEIQVIMLTFQFSFFGPLLAGKWAWPLWPGSSKPDQKVGPLGGPFGSTAISKFSRVNPIPLNFYCFIICECFTGKSYIFCKIVIKLIYHRLQWFRRGLNQ